MSYRPAALMWTKYTVTYADLAGANPSNNIQLFSLPAGGVIHTVKIKHSISFTGGGLNSYTVTVGVGGNTDKYLGDPTPFDVFQAPGASIGRIATLADAVSPYTMESQTSSTSIVIEGIADGATGLATAGSVDVWVLKSVAN